MKNIILILVLVSFVQAFEHFTTIDKAGILSLSINGGCRQADINDNNSQLFANSDQENILRELENASNLSYYHGLELRYGATANIVFGLAVKQLISNFTGLQDTGQQRILNTSINIVEINFYDHLIGSDFLSFYFGMGCSLLDYQVIDSNYDRQGEGALLLQSRSDSGRNYGWQLIGGLELQPIKALALYGEVRLRKNLLLLSDYSVINLSGTYFEIGVRRELW